MSTAEYSIGIDLGTTNCALAYAPLDGEISASEVMPVSQWDSANSLVESDTLPSFLYLPLEEEARQLQGKSGGGTCVAGRFARSRLGSNPGRVVASAKSWLSTSGVDQNTNFLPWGDDELGEAGKLSPVLASAQLLNYLRGEWNDRFGDAPFDDQEITITVPASFDAAAQRLTLRAAGEAGFPGDIRLLEEPQAAFYRWLETHDAGRSFEESLPELAGKPQTVLVVDIGGGTSDFSLFEVRKKKNRPLPEIRRIAVSDHILLGGDNIDLAMAHVVAEIQLEGSLSPAQWSHLIARCRQIKEDVLDDPDRTDPFQLSIPGRGSGLFAATLTAELAPDDVRLILFEGFYPECGADDVPERSSAGLREFGLPYARDHAVTRHLAEFLRGRPRVDAILFNGGSLKPEAIQERIRDQIGKWQDHVPVILPNPEPDLAVARGAAGYGWFLRHQSSRIEAGAPRSLFLKAQQGDGVSLVCVMPKGTPREEELVIDELDLELQANRPVAFQILSSTRIEDVAPGEVLSGKEKNQEFHRLPPLETIAASEGRESIPVHLSTKLNALGILQLECVDLENPGERWPLEFNVTGSHHPAAASSSGEAADLGVPDEQIGEAETRMEFLFSREINKRDKLTANRLTKGLEKILGLPKQEWNALLLRKLWEKHAENLEWCYLSADHEEAWLTFAGFLLRPGFGVRFDEERIDRLWRSEEIGYDFPGKRIDLARYVLWRRVSGGLDRERQDILGEECLRGLEGKKPPSAELIRLTGALERLGVEKKEILFERLLSRAEELAAEEGYSDPYWVSLMLLLNRAPLYAGPETVLPVEDVATAFEKLRRLDWEKPELAGIVPLFLRAARQVDTPTLDLPKKLRRDIIAKLRRSGVSPVRLVPLEEFVEMEATDQAGLLGETLPPGLVLK